MKPWLSSLSIRLSGGGGGWEKESLTQQPGFEPSASLKYDTLLLAKQPMRLFPVARHVNKLSCVYLREMKV